MVAPNDDREIASLIRTAMGGAALLVAHQVAAKAVRDALFLDQFPVTDLPKMVGTAAVIAVLSGLLFAQMLVNGRPALILKITLAASVLLHLAEYALITRYRSSTVVFTYLHIISSSSITLSLFWSIASDALSPGEAKRYFGRIAAAGTVGGVAGGLAAAQVSNSISVDSLLLMLALLQAASVAIVMMLGRYRESHTRSQSSEGFVSTVRGAIQRAPFLRSLALLVLLSTVGGVIVDFLFKSSATSTYGKGPALASFFALFYTGTQVATFLLQVTVTPFALRALGLGRTVMTAPVFFTGGGLLSLWFPVLLAFTSTRIADIVLKGSLFRAGYELFFTAIPAHERRTVKTAIDVGCDRTGEVIAAGLLQAFLMLGLDAATRPLLILMIAFGAACIWISVRMDPAYLRALEQGLLHRAIELKDTDVEDSTTMAGLSGWMNSVPRMATIAAQSLLQSESPSSPQDQIPAQEAAPVQRKPVRQQIDPAVDQLRTLRSGIASDVKRALAQNIPFDAIAVPQMIRLLAWDEVTDSARKSLELHADRVAGQLADALIDPDQDFSVRRRIPRILARVSSQRVVEALVEVLSDPRFEIRFQCSRALEFLHLSNPDLHFNAAHLMEIVDRELSVSRPIWEGRRLLDKRDHADGPLSFLDEILQDRAHQSLEHVFSLLAIMLPRDPLKVAFRALHGEDRVLRGLGLEYLETALSPKTFKLFSAMIEASPPATRREPQDVLNSLMASQASIGLQLKIASADAHDPSPRPRPTTPV